MNVYLMLLYTLKGAKSSLLILEQGKDLRRFKMGDLESH